MRTHRYSTSRQKACQQCARARAKCDRTPGGCARCAQRGLACVYPYETAQTPSSISSSSTRPARRAPRRRSAGGNAPTPSTTTQRALSSPDATTTPTPRSAEPPSLPRAPPPQPPAAAAGAPAAAADDDDVLDFTRLDLVCPIDTAAVSARWLHPYVPVPGQVPKTYPPRVAALLARVLGAYAGAAARGRALPPFVHPAPLAAVQVRPPAAAAPLAACLGLVRACAPPRRPGSDAGAVEALGQAMARLRQQSAAVAAATADDDDGDDGGLERLAIFQAYLLYAMILFFLRPDDPAAAAAPRPSPRLAMMDLQELASATCADGLRCRVELRERARPRWEAWLATEAKRRALFTMYLFDSVLSAHEGLPTFLGTELRGLPAPAAKALWAARTRREWEGHYNLFLAEWPDGGLGIDELWAMPADFDEAAVARRRARVDQWLQDVDEFGMMIYAVTSCTHGG